MSLQAGSACRLPFSSLSPTQSPVQSPPPVQFQFQFTPPALPFPHMSLLPPPSLPLSLVSLLPLLPSSPPEPVVEAEPIRELPITYMDRVFPLYPVGSPTTSAPSEIETSTPCASTTMITRDTQLSESVLSVPSGSLVSAPRPIGPVAPPYLDLLRLLVLRKHCCRLRL